MTKSKDFSSDSWRCRWHCPDPAPLAAAQEERLLKITDSIAKEWSGTFRAVDTIGLEIRMSFISAESEYFIESNDNNYWKNKCRILFLRPSVEPIAISYWDRIVLFDLDHIKAQKLVSALTIKEQLYRTKEGVGRSTNGNVGFENPEHARKWLCRIKDAYSINDLYSLMPGYIFASTIMAHPFQDGNGRLARLLTLGALAKLGGWEGPIVGLAPSFYRNAERLGNSLYKLSDTGQWGSYMEVILDILDDAKNLLAKFNQIRG